MIREDPLRAVEVATKLFPAVEAGLMGQILARDAEFYQPSISAAAIEEMKLLCDSRLDCVVFGFVRAGCRRHNFETYGLSNEHDVAWITRPDWKTRILRPYYTRGTCKKLSKTGTRLITLGTAAGPSLRPDRAQSSNLLTVNGTHYVVDAGDGVARRLAKAGIDVREIGMIFITHHHDDHTAGLGTLMSLAWDRQRTKPINVYGPPRTEELVKAAVQYFTISAEIRIADGGRTVPIAQVFFGHDVGTGVIYQDANIKVTAVENSHFCFP